MKDLAIIIPVFNEEKTISKVVKDWSEIIETDQLDLIIVNDGSSDQTFKILENLKKNVLNLIVINKKNQGHGYAICEGYKFASQNNYHFIFQTDSDDQFFASDFIKLWNKKGNIFEIILGSRASRKDPFIRVFLSKVILRTLLSIFFGKYIHDANIPYRLINRKFLKTFLKINPEKYIAPNLIMSLFAKKIIKVNINHRMRIFGENQWPLKKLISFGIKLIKDLYFFKINK
jgi:dolichol-phosphate mannosyltransferase